MSRSSSRSIRQSSRPITAGDAVPNKDAGAAHNRPPNRRWCEDAKAICVQSRYMFEGKIPAGIQLANKLREESKKPIPDFIEFQSEIMLVTQPHLAELPSLTGLTPQSPADSSRTSFG